jgi:hypothetical protein
MYILIFKNPTVQASNKHFTNNRRTSDVSQISQNDKNKMIVKQDQNLSLRSRCSTSSPLIPISNNLEFQFTEQSIQLPPAKKQRT